jgi:hypothetical protein
MATAIEQDTCDVCRHPVDEFEDHGFGRLMVGTCDDCSACNDDWRAHLRALDRAQVEAEGYQP